MPLDYYDILGLSRSADDELVEKAYRVLAKRHHPDAGEADARRFARIQEAYEALSDPKRRAAYDSSRVEIEQSGRAGPRDLYQVLPLRFEQAAHGGRITVTRIADTGPRTVDIDVPQAIDGGERLRIQGLGLPGDNGQQPGDLVLIVTVSPHRTFRREGLDLYVDTPVPVDIAMLGGRVKAPTLDGLADVDVPPGTSGGTLLRVRAKGLRNHNGQHGDLFAVVRIKIPKAIAEEARELAGGAAAAARVNACLVLTDTQGNRRDLVITRAETLIGRKSPCDLIIPDTSVSRRHCQFELRDDGLWVRDVGSRNGTFVNREKMTMQKLEPGDVVSVGHAQVNVVIDGEPADLTPTPSQLREPLDAIEYMPVHTALPAADERQQQAYAARLAELDRQEQDLEDQREQVARVRRDLDQQRAHFEQERADLEKRAAAPAPAAAAPPPDPQIEQIAADRKALEADRKAMAADRKAIEAERAELTAARSQLEAARTSLAAERQQLAAGLDEAAADRRDRERELEAARKRLESDRAALERDVASASAAVAEHQSVRSTLDAERAALAQGLAALERERASAKHSLDAEHRRLESDRKEMEQERAAFLATRDAASADATGLGAQRDALEQLRAQLEADRRGLAEQDRALRSRAESVESERAAAAASADDLVRRSAELDERASAIAGERAALDASRRELEAAGQQIEAERAAAEQRAGSLAADRAAAIKVINSLEQRSRELDARAGEAEAAVAKIAEDRRRLDADRSAIERDRAALDRDRAALDEAEEALATSAADLERRTASLDARDGELTARAAALTARHGELDKRSAALEQRESQLTAGAEAAERLAAELTAREAALAENLSALRARATELDARVVAVDADLAGRTKLMQDYERELADRAAAIEVERLAIERAGADLREQTTAWERRSADLDAKTGSLDDRAAALERELAELERRGAEAEAERGRNESAAAARLAVIVEQERRVSERLAGLERAEREHQSRAEHLAAAEREAEQRIATLESQAAQLVEQIQTLTRSGRAAAERLLGSIPGGPPVSAAASAAVAPPAVAPAKPASAPAAQPTVTPVTARSHVSRFRIARADQAPPIDLTPNHLRAAAGYRDRKGHWHLFVDFIEKDRPAGNNWNAELRYYRSDNGVAWDWVQAPVQRGEWRGSAESSDPDCYSVASPAVLVAGDQLLLFYAGRGSLEPGKAPNILAAPGEPGYLRSTIMLATARVDADGSPAEPFIKRGPVVAPGKSWDALRVDQPSAVVEGDRVHVFYTGYDNARDLTRRKVGHASASLADLRFEKTPEPVLEVHGGGEMPRVFRLGEFFHLFYQHFDHMDAARWRHYATRALPHFDLIDADLFPGPDKRPGELMIWTDATGRLLTPHPIHATAIDHQVHKLMPYRLEIEE